MAESLQNQLPQIKTALPGPQAQQVLAEDREFVSPSYTRPYPLVVRRAEGAMLEDVDGNVFMDFSSGIAVTSTGHCHPQVVEAIRRQAGELIHMSGTDFYYPGLSKLARKLSDIAPGDLPRRISFCNSGAEAVEGALKLARFHTGRDKFIAFTGAFHGRTMGALSLTASKPTQRHGFSPLVPGVVHIPYAYCYRCIYNLKPADCAMHCARIIEEHLFRTMLPPDEVAGIVVEPIQGEGGYVDPPAEFLRELRRICDRHGILLIVDEVQSGFGRTGRMWACEDSGVVPDILCVAKGIASGLPLGATIARADIMDWPPGAHASTFGGNPVAIAAALETIELIETRYRQNAAEVGEYMLARMREWPRKLALVGDVRGRGLMLGIELVEDRQSRKPAEKQRGELLQRAFARGLILLGCGPNSLRLIPPLNIRREQADWALDVLESLLTELAPQDRK